MISMMMHKCMMKRHIIMANFLKLLRGNGDLGRETVALRRDFFESHLGTLRLSL